MGFMPKIQLADLLVEEVANFGLKLLKNRN